MPKKGVLLLYVEISTEFGMDFNYFYIENLLKIEKNHQMGESSANFESTREFLNQ